MVIIAMKLYGMDGMSEGEEEGGVAEVCSFQSEHTALARSRVKWDDDEQGKSYGRLRHIWK